MVNEDFRRQFLERQRDILPDSVNFKDWEDLEAQCIAAQDSQSFGMWLFSGLLRFFKQDGYVPSDPALVEKFCSSIVSAQVRTNALLQKVQAYHILSRRRMLLRSIPDLGEAHKSKLMGSNVFSGQVFDQQTLDAVLAQYWEDLGKKTSLSLAQAVKQGLSPSVSNPRKKKKQEKSDKGHMPSGSGLQPSKSSSSGGPSPNAGGSSGGNSVGVRTHRGGKSGGGGRSVTKNSGNQKKGFRN